jgi:ribosomal protein S27AE
MNGSGDIMRDELTRRDFLKGAGLAAAGAVGASFLSRPGWAQQEEDEKDQKEQKPDERPKDEAKPEDPPEEPNYDDLFENNETGEEETRACPQCGALMYRQGRTWTCENCGYSYVE